MSTSVILFFSGAIMFLFFAVGITIGWTANDFAYGYVQSRQSPNLHPEMYDDDGIVINEELLSVRFVDEEEEEEEDDYYWHEPNYD